MVDQSNALGNLCKDIGKLDSTYDVGCCLCSILNPHESHLTILYFVDGPNHQIQM